MIYEVNYFVEYDYEKGEPIWDSKFFKNRKEAFKFMVSKQNHSPCLFMYSKKNFNLFYKEFEA